MRSIKTGGGSNCQINKKFKRFVKIVERGIKTKQTWNQENEMTDNYRETCSFWKSKVQRKRNYQSEITWN